MVALENLSKIGLGTYRMSINNESHLTSLKYAVENGVNLIDTASNYINGDSERLIGDYIQKKGREKIFVISKAGYIHGNDLKTFSAYLDKKSCIKVQQGFYHTFEKSFLKKQLKHSLDRLNTEFLDGFLIHNPEYYFSGQNSNENDFYSQITESLNFLEGLVKKGVIRYYGISSNKLPTGEVNIWRILNERDNFPHFKLLQFPHNLVENDATKLNRKESLLDFCKKNEILTFANRPLTTTFDEKVLRIADYSNEISTIDFKKEQSFFDDFISAVSNRLIDFDPNAKPTDFTTLNILINKRKEMANPEAVDKIVYEHLVPFIYQLQFKDQEKIISTVKELSSYWKAYSKALITKRAGVLKEQLISKGKLNKTDKRDLSLVACEKYLKEGVNHVLVGMRKREYVDKLKSILN